MKITDIPKSQLPLRVKLNDRIFLDEGVDPESIIQITNYHSIGDDCYKVIYNILASDMTHNLSVCKNDWFDDNHVACLNYYVANENMLTKDSDGNYVNDCLYAMGIDDCFDLISDLDKFYSNTQLIEHLWVMFKMMHPIIVCNKNADVENIRNVDFVNHLNINNISYTSELINSLN